METFYLIIVIILFLLAISDLIVGVSNDAVNFLNAAIGAKASTIRVIMAVAAAGIVVGASFSSGMMEVARKGVFNPQEFYFSEIMIIFLAVMIADVIILDSFNTFGLPTSTTVSIVFELLGAAVGMAFIKMMMAEETRGLSAFINSSQALAIIAGILLSIVIAFNAGAIIQFLTRILFSFDYKKRLNWLGSVFGGLALTAITYFLLIKGAEGAVFMSDIVVTWIGKYTWQIMLYSFVGWSILFQVLYMAMKMNVFRVIVLVGTFALAMAFAGNDLVNFIGVPLAGYSSYTAFIKGASPDPDTFTMEALAGSVDTSGLFLILAGLIMVITLYTSRKARSVVQTTLDLSRQDEGDERFSSNRISKFLVRFTMSSSDLINKIVPSFALRYIDKQFMPLSNQLFEESPPAFDLVRAAVTLVVSSTLIAMGTSLTLPLSTTYVTFMVAMGTSLADRAWDRESAVYRITGVFAVIGGWFMTAIIAFSLALGLIFLFYYGGMFGIIFMLGVAAYMIYRTHTLYRRTAARQKEERQEVLGFTDENILEKSTSIITKSLRKVLVGYDLTIKGLENESLKDLKMAQKSIDQVSSRINYLKNHINIIVDKIRAEYLDSGYYYIQVLDYMSEILKVIEQINKPAISHIENNHKPFLREQTMELRGIEKCLKSIYFEIIGSLEEKKYYTIEEILKMQDKCFEKIEETKRNQIKRIKNQEVGTRNSVLFLGLIQESRNLTTHGVNLFIALNDFFAYRKGASH